MLGTDAHAEHVTTELLLLYGRAETSTDWKAGIAVSPTKEAIGIRWAASTFRLYPSFPTNELRS